MPMRVIMTYKMKKLISTILFTLLLPLFCFAQNAFHFSLAPRVSFTYGELNEILYGYNGEIVSQLNWNQKPLLNLGLEASAGYKKLIVSALFDYSIPLKTSYMYDTDWNSAGDIESLSKHPIEHTINLNSELSIKYDFQISPAISLLPIISFDYLFTDFNAGIGTKSVYIQYPRANKIDYYRHSFFIFTGLCIKLSPLEKLSLAIDFLTAPFSYQYAYDYHYGTKSPYPFSSYEIQTGYFSKFKTNLSADYKIKSFLTLKLFVNLLLSIPDRGDFYTNYYSDSFYQASQKSGATISSTKIGTAVIFTF